MTAIPAPSSAAARIASVDALRGLTVAAMLLVNTPGDWGHVYAPLLHADWHGWTPTDLVFPFFLFIVGVSLSLSMGARIAAGQGAGLQGTVLKRAMRIVVLGLALNALAWWMLDKPAFRVFGVLQRIGLCFALAGLVVLHVRAKGQWLWIIGLLAGWGALLWSGGTLAPELNIASRVDAWLLGPHAYQWNAATGLGHEPEGLLSTLGAVATTLIGFRCGEWLRRGQLVLLTRFAVLAAAVGWILDAIGAMPINKHLWTPSYVLWTGGLAALALWGAHWLVDRRGWPPVGRSFGVNAIAAYAGSWIAVILLAGLGWMAPLYAHGFGWIARAWGPTSASLAFAVCFVLCWAVVVRVLDHQRIYIKV